MEPAGSSAKRIPQGGLARQVRLAPRTPGPRPQAPGPRRQAPGPRPPGPRAPGKGRGARVGRQAAPRSAGFDHRDPPLHPHKRLPAQETSAVTTDVGFIPAPSSHSPVVSPSDRRPSATPVWPTRLSPERPQGVTTPNPRLPRGVGRGVWRRDTSVTWVHERSATAGDLGRFSSRVGATAIDPAGTLGTLSILLQVCYASRSGPYHSGAKTGESR